MISTVPFAPSSFAKLQRRRLSTTQTTATIPKNNGNQTSSQGKSSNSNGATASASAKLPQNVIGNFCAPLNLPIPTTKRLEKSVLLERLGIMVQEIQLSSACRSTCQSHALTYANRNVKSLCRLLDFLLSYGLKRISDSYWPLAREFSTKGQIAFLSTTWKEKPNRARALSWLYQCLNDGLLEFQMQDFSRKITTVRKFYAKSAYVWEVETLETVAIFLRGLENVAFRLFSLDQASTMDFTDMDFIAECCPENERILSASSSKTNVAAGVSGGASTSNSNLANPNVVKVSPSRKIQRQRGVSTSSVDGGSLAHSFETSVADFSECPDVLGLTPDLQNRMLLDTDLCDEAIDFNFPPLHLGALRKSSVLTRKKAKPSSPRPSTTAAITTTTAVRKIIDQQPTIDTDQCSLIDESCDMSSTSIRVPVQQNKLVSIGNQGRSVDRFSSLDLDPDAMFSEIIARPRVVDVISGSLPMSSTPIVSGHGIFSNSVTELKRKTDGLASTAATAGEFLKPESSQDSVQSAQPISSNGFAVLKYGDVIIDENGFPIACTPADQTQFPSSIPRIRSSASAVQLRCDEEAKEQKRTDFETQIRRRLQTVSDLVAMYSDSISEHSGESGRVTKDRKRDDVEGIVEDEVKMVMGVNGTGNAEVPLEIGEIIVESGEIVQLTMHTFKNDGEQFIKMYRIFINHHLGNSLPRYLLLTNYAVYVLKLNLSSLNKSDGDEIFNGKRDDSESKYSTDAMVPYSVIDYISVGANGQLFNIFTLQKKQPVATVCTCNENLTNIILSKIESALNRFTSWSDDKSSNSIPGPDRISAASVVTDATPQIIAMKKWLCGELGKEDIEINRYCMVYWNPNAVKIDDQNRDGDSVSEDKLAGTSRSGYLYIREYFPSGWIWKSSEWKQSYFLLRGKKLYQFEDSTCKMGERVFDLKEEINGCRQVQTNEYAYCMEMTFHKDENVKVHLGCQTKHELQQWLYAFVACFSQADVEDVTCECVSCCAVVAAKHLVLGQESSNLGFVRTLAVVKLDNVVSCIWCPTHFSVLMEFSSKTENSHQRWLVSFACDSEFRNFIKVLCDQKGRFSCGPPYVQVYPMPLLVHVKKTVMTPEKLAALKVYILKQRQKKKEEEEQDEALRNERQRLAEKKLRDQHTLEEVNTQIAQLEKKLAEFRQEKHDLFAQLKKVLHQEDEQKRRIQQIQQQHAKDASEILARVGPAPPPLPLLSSTGGSPEEIASVGHASFQSPMQIGSMGFGGQMQQLTPPTPANSGTSPGSAGGGSVSVVSGIGGLKRQRSPSPSASIASKEPGAYTAYFSSPKRISTSYQRSPYQSSTFGQDMHSPPGMPSHQRVQHGSATGNPLLSPSSRSGIVQSSMHYQSYLPQGASTGASTVSGPAGTTTAGLMQQGRGGQLRSQPSAGMNPGAAQSQRVAGSGQGPSSSNPSPAGIPVIPPPKRTGSISSGYPVQKPPHGSATSTFQQQQRQYFSPQGNPYPHSGNRY